MLELEILAMTSVRPLINKGIAVFKKRKEKINEWKKNESKQKRGLNWFF